MATQRSNAPARTAKPAKPKVEVTPDEPTVVDLSDDAVIPDSSDKVGTTVHIAYTDKRKLGQRCQRTGEEHADVMMLAIEHCHERYGLAKVVKGTEETGDSGGLFRSRPRSTRRPANDPLVPVSAQFYKKPEGAPEDEEDDYDVLDALVVSAKARSRSSLIACTIHRFFIDTNENLPGEDSS